ncbi:hypothetical protein [Paraburkholderia fungorum]|jgi:hypothetical protein|uniref:hypothetical protein n=1 Tax=Paraburkholderia fungorum TaxID=134537 RepID=UPI000D434208|nr:hypothetical protein [Paraburkholderia fungorum]PRZ42891.1 hypothetical protein BX589_1547 [Paraburkholderia fungorum]
MKKTIVTLITATSLFVSAQAHAGLGTMLVIGAVGAGGGAALLSKSKVDCTQPDTAKAHPFICGAKAKVAQEKQKLADAKAARAAQASATSATVAK